ncbi:hypothetical protein T492DRAFT_603798 [Pavlovales sp. CCMP2436]|nr:hypothetical protein T492DRAFT_603798 [Pavlovales sp. CCMP2436]|mmetsp:Transcript_51149/g.120226  ORF Transcript_51149/g.120226 Transcript_51149/m.120226 type:complete len:233 (-) Transcript_51149:102-800(-)
MLCLLAAVAGLGTAAGPARSTALLKADLVRACALCDRGFSARPATRRRIDELVQQLIPLSDVEDCTAGLDGTIDGRPTPIVALWELVYTDAADVIALGANPFIVVGSVYQDIRQPPVSLNLIELSPRGLNAQLSLDTTFRLKVSTRAYVRSPKRAGLSFEQVGGTPLTFLGAAILPSFAPPSLNLPSSQEQAETGRAYFDIKYLDEDMLIIKQSSPGGYFVSVRASDFSNDE